MDRPQGKIGTNAKVSLQGVLAGQPLLAHALQRGSEADSGVAGRLFERILAGMTDPAYGGQIRWIWVTNFPNRLDSALKRPGRFGDLKLAIPPPLRRSGPPSSRFTCGATAGRTWPTCRRSAAPRRKAESRPRSSRRCTRRGN
jgi:hypothetical protein